MLTITEAARAYLLQTLNDLRLSEEFAFRLDRDGQSIMLQPDHERPGDTSVQHGGRTILLLDTGMSDRFSRDTLDLSGEELMLTRQEHE